MFDIYFYLSSKKIKTIIFDNTNKVCYYIRILITNIRIYNLKERSIFIMPLKPVFSDSDKERIRKKLEQLCEECWTRQGYKKTSIKNLCDKAEISIGTFYTLYPTKEDLFAETIKNIQNKLAQKVIDTSRDNPSKEGFAKAIKELFREYNDKPFLYNVNSTDFCSFVGKLSSEAVESIRFDSIMVFRKSIEITGLKLKIDEQEAYGVFSALLSTISAKDTLSTICDYYTVFDFMVDSLIEHIFQ